MTYIEGPEGLYVPEKTGGRLIATDHDETVADHLGALTAFVNSVLHTNFTVNDYHEPDYHLTWGVTAEEGYELVQLFHQRPELDELTILPGVAEGMAEIARKNNLVVVTGRKPSLREMTMRWYDRNLPGIVSGFHFTGHYLQEEGFTRRSKAEVCQELGADLLIEDLLEHAKLCAERGIPTLLIDRPWNQEELPPNVIRVRDFREAADYITQLPPKDL